MNPLDELTDETLVELVRRCDVFGALADRPLSKSDFVAELDVSKATVHRLLASFQEKHLVERTDAGYTLTPLGARIGDYVRSYRSNVADAHRLEPLYETLTRADVDVEPKLFADATITLPTVGGRYKPVERFARLLRESSSVRGFDSTAAALLFVEAGYEAIVDGMEAELVYPIEILQHFGEAYRQESLDTAELDNLSVYAHDGLPFGMALLDDRIAIGGYDPTVGVPFVFG
ncbi:helix-turn-helix transcriptional regulator [Haladaptatus sp. NG-WS-4]